ncbi:MAG: Asp-tRNA(Asn)/Glu-tRNA(Gln) amidotransferase subunit GatA, partial [Magnetococcales bacterium]|nr:Asp-tRNA(Asn)/Glu-tRNA(Gln) amidotransferase subunit GatA [Magnetococcales bacterium]
TSHFGITRNPWDLDRIPGGSSGGSSAAVAADLCICATGTDTGGSIRQPAAVTGITGLKPTYGRVSRFGIVAFASSLDQPGTMTKSVADSAHMLKAIAGHDPKDSTSINQAVPDYAAGLTGDIRGKRIGIPDEYFADGIDQSTRAALEKALETLKELGAQVVPVQLPHTEYGVPTYYIIAPAEASSNLARYDGVKYGYRAPNPKNLRDMYYRTRADGFGSEVKRRIMLGTYALSSGYYDAYYGKAQRVRRLIANDFSSAFEKVDVILGPTSPTTAFKLGEKTDDPVQMYLSDIFTINVNLAGLPGMSLPCGFDSQGLPIGMQLIGRPLGEETILQVGHAYEQATEWHTRKPTL